MIYIFALINFFLAFAATISDNVTIGSSNVAVHVNSPHALMSTTLIMSIIGIFMTTAIMNNSILKDFEHKFDGILFSTPLSKWGFLGARFSAGFLLSLIPYFGIFLGIGLGAATSWVDASQAGPFYFGSYLSTFFLAALPNTFLVAAFVFMLAALFRSNLFSFIGAMVILIGYLVMISFTQDIDNEIVAIIVDPLAVSSYNVLTKYWTVDEQNSQWLTFSGWIMVNRLLWIMVSLAILVFTFVRFSFARKRPLFSRKSKGNVTPPTYEFGIQKLDPLPVANIQHGIGTSVKQFWYQTKIEFFSIVKSTPFIVITLMGIFNMMGALPYVDESYGTGNHPVTYLMISAIRGTIYLFLIGMLMYYTGVVVWRERDHKMNEFYDASPFATWIPFTSKLLAMIGILFILQVVSILCGMAFQVLGGYFNFELGVYVRELLVYDLLTFVPLIILSMLLQTLIHNKYLAYFAFILFIIIMSYGARALEIQSNLLLFAEVPGYTYSDMNEWSPFSNSLHWFFSYWTLFSALLCVVAIIFWYRGKSLTFGQRWNIAKSRFSGNLAYIGIGLLVVWISTASFLTYQTTVVNEMTSEKVMEKRQVDYELKYKKYQGIPQPRITAIDYDIEIYPEERDFTVHAGMKVINKSSGPIDSLHFVMPRWLDVTLEVPGSALALDDDDLKYRIYTLDQPMAPGDSMVIDVTSKYVSTGIENEVSNTAIVSNGTFLHSNDLIPSLGYTDTREMSGKKSRKDYKLPEKDRMHKLHENCTASCQNTYISHDADWVKIQTKISTSADQIAVAPGSLVREWEEGGRRYFEYDLEQEALNFFSFISAKYEVARDIWTSPEGEKVDVEIYYHKGHEYNVDKMIRSIKNSLTYFSENFAPYPHKQARIIEFPRYSSFAQAFPGTMPYSESIGFIADLNEEDAIDMVYYVVAHEMAHQWWAHQVIGANVQGMTMLSETFAQYGALMVMKKEYGKDKMKQFLRYEMDSYLRNRGSEREKELPLMYVEDQPYIHYRKGSVIMYALQDYIGEDSLNLALKRYIDDFAYQEPPYTTTLDVMQYIRQVTPDSLQGFIDDMFEYITLYDLRTEDATYRKLGDDKYEVTFDVRIEKFRADTLGKETTIPHNDFFDVGIYSEETEEGHRYGRPILEQRFRISGKDTSFTFIVDELPYQVGIDPNYLMIDRMPEDNVKRVDLEE